MKLATCARIGSVWTIKDSAHKADHTTQRDRRNRDQTAGVSETELDTHVVPHLEDTASWHTSCREMLPLPRDAFC